MADFQIIYNLEYTTRIVSGKVINIRKVLDKTIAIKEMHKYSKVKYKNAILRIVEVKEIYQKDKTVEKLKDLFNMN